MSSCVTLLVALIAIAGANDRRSMVRFGGDRSRGVLVDHTPGVLDPSRPTVVFIHGLNPAPGVVHFTMTEELAEALDRRGGPAFNVLGWNWNAATLAGPGRRANRGGAIGQGHALAEALMAAGVPPPRTHLVGHSSGGIVAASAARTLLARRGEPVAHLTLLEPAAFYHDLIFDELAAGSSARLVENYWTPGPSGFGRHVPHAGVWNTRVDGPTPYLGAVWPLRSSHLYIVDWYVATAADPSYRGGFNTSLLLRR